MICGECTELNHIGAPSWILLFTQAGSEFRTAIPGGVTSEKFFPSAEDPVGAGKLLTQVASRKPARTPAPTGAAALLLREAAPHPPRPHGSLGGVRSRGGRAGNHVKPSLETAALRHPERMLAQLRNIREINSTQCF